MAKGNQRGQSSGIGQFRYPSSPDLEAQVLGAIFIKPNLLDELLAIINESAFYNEAHQYIWRAILTLKDLGRPIDITLVHEQLLADGVSEKCSSPLYLTKLCDSVAAPHTAIEWSRDLKGYAQRRALMQAGFDLIKGAQDHSADSRQIALQGQDDVQVVLEGHEQGVSQDPKQIAFAWMDHLEALVEQGGPLLTTHYKQLNNILSGFFPGEQTVIAGRPSTGKTALGVNLVENAILRGIGCGIFSLEMTRFMLFNRLAASNRVSGSGAEINAMRFRDGNLSKSDWERVYAFAGNISHLPLRIWDRPRLTPTDFYIQCRLWKKQIDMKFVLLDYLQLMEPDHRGSSREREISEMSRKIKQAANELGVHIVLLCQLNRESERSKRPLLSHLRESGSLEQDADNVIFIVPWRAEERAIVPVDIDVAKGRNNSIGTVKLNYRRTYLQFVNPVEDDLCLEQ